MTNKEVLIAIIIHLLIPVIGVIIFLHVKKKMEVIKIENPPLIEIFVIFATYGGLLLVLLTSFFWQWSAMASLGAFYLLIGAPILMAVILYRLKKTKSLSTFHRMAFLSALLYFGIMPLVIFIMFAIHRS